MSARAGLAFARVTSMDDAPPPLRPVRILLTGFGKFDMDQDGRLEDNKSEIVPSRYVDRAEEIAVDHPSGRVVKASITGALLDVTWSRDQPGGTGAAGAADVLEDLVRARQPDVLVATGMRRKPFSVDTTANDVDQPRAKDVTGRAFTEARLQYSATDETRRFLPTMLPVSRIEARWQKLGVDWMPSDSAGNYICNDVFYRAVWLARYGGVKSLHASGFVHVPDWATTPELEVAIDAVLRATVESLDLAPFALKTATRRR